MYTIRMEQRDIEYTPSRNTPLNLHIQFAKEHGEEWRSKNREDFSVTRNFGFVMHVFLFELSTVWGSWRALGAWDFEIY
jgi:hypothetical protein